MVWDEEEEKGENYSRCCEAKEEHSDVSLFEGELTGLLVRQNRVDHQEETL